MELEIVSVNISRRKGVKKTPVTQITLVENYGIRGDAHAGMAKRQVSLLAEEDIDTIRRKLPSIRAGDFAENITTRGIDLPSLPLGTVLVINGVKLEVTQIGKECHDGCEIKQLTGDCVMPRRGIFARVLSGGTIKTGDRGHRQLIRG